MITIQKQKTTDYDTKTRDDRLRYKTNKTCVIEKKIHTVIGTLDIIKIWSAPITPTYRPIRNKNGMTNTTNAPTEIKHHET